MRNSEETKRTLSFVNVVLVTSKIEPMQKLSNVTKCDYLELKIV